MVTTLMTPLRRPLLELILQLTARDRSPDHAQEPMVPILISRHTSRQPTCKSAS